MPVPNVSKEASADAVAGLGNYVSVHEGDPTTSGSGEPTGLGSPVYARKPTTWPSDPDGASDGVRTGSQVALDVPAGMYSWFGVWSQAAGGLLTGYGEITFTVLDNQGRIKITPHIVSS